MNSKKTNNSVLTIDYDAAIAFALKDENHLNGTIPNVLGNLSSLVSLNLCKLDESLSVYDLVLIQSVLATSFNPMFP